MVNLNELLAVSYQPLALVGNGGPLEQKLAAKS